MIYEGVALGRKIIGVATFFMLLLLGSCTTSVVVKGTVPTPLVSKIPANIGVFYPEEFKSFKYTEVIRDSGTWNIDLGAQNLLFFRNLTKALFTSVHEVSEPPLSPEVMDVIMTAAPESDETWAEHRAALTPCLEKVSSSLRKMIDLRYCDNLPPAQIAREVSWSVEAVYVALTRARRFLRSCIEQAMAVKEN